jgi:hypothetical protein
MKKRSFAVRLALAAAACALLAQGAAFAQTAPIALTKPVQASKADVDPGRLYSSPAFAVDPEDSMRVVAGYADLRTRRCGLLRSLDGGTSWTKLDASPALASYPFCSQGQGGVIQAPVAFGRNGTLYMALGGWDDQDGTRNAGAVLLARSANLGDSWETTVVDNARGKTGDGAENVRPVHALAVDRFSGSDDAVYVTFNVSRPNLTAPNAAPTFPMVGVSRDGGRTFAEPVNLADQIFENEALRDQAFTAVTTTVPAPGATTTTSTTPPAGSKAAQPNQAANFAGSSGRASITAGVDGKGTAYVLWLSGTANVTPAPPSARFLSTSTDGGRTWATTQTMPFSYDNASPRMAVSRTGVIHIVYGRNPKPDIAGYGEIFHQASADGGQTWSEPKALTDDDPARLVGQYFPNVSVAPNGRVDAVWWDTRDDPGIRANDVYYAYSNDNGKTWSKNQRITDLSVDRRVGIWGANYDIASPPAVTSTNAYAMFGWDDTRLTTEVYDAKVTSEFGGGLQDVYTSVAQFAVVGGSSSNTARIVLAAVVGLLVVGLALLAAALAARRRNPPPAKNVADEQAAAKVG